MISLRTLLVIAVAAGCNSGPNLDGALTGSVECGDFAGIYVDTFTFEATSGDTIGVRTDSVSEETAFEVQGFVFEGLDLVLENLLDDNYAEVLCSFDGYTCVDFAFDAPSTGTYTAGVGPFSSRCNSDPGEYAFWVTVNGEPATTTQVEDDFLLDI